MSQTVGFYYRDRHNWQQKEKKNEESNFVMVGWFEWNVKTFSSRWSRPKCLFVRKMLLKGINANGEKKTKEKKRRLALLMGSYRSISYVKWNVYYSVIFSLQEAPVWWCKRQEKDVKKKDSFSLCHAWLESLRSFVTWTRFEATDGRSNVIHISDNPFVINLVERFFSPSKYR